MNMGEERKEGWRIRATNLNSRILPEKFYEVPGVIDGNGGNQLRKWVMKSLSIEWGKIVKVFRSAICRTPRVDDSNMIRKIGGERVVMKHQIFRQTTLSTLMRVIMFGEDMRTVFVGNEVIHRTDRVVVAHIDSWRRVRELLTINGLSATSFDVEGGNRICCGRISMGRDNNRDTVGGYILDSVGNNWIVRLENNTTIKYSEVEVGC